MSESVVAYEAELRLKSKKEIMCLVNTNLAPWKRTCVLRELNARIPCCVECGKKAIKGYPITYKWEDGTSDELMVCGECLKRD